MGWKYSSKEEYVKENNRQKMDRYKTDPSFREYEKEKARNRWYTAGAKAARLKKYGITQEDYDNLFIKQEGRCAIGGEPLPETPHIDHDHDTGYVRGLLCKTHNTALGMFGDNWEILEKASQYVFQGKVRYLND